MLIEQMNQYLEMGTRAGASDIHFKPGGPPAYRVNGRLQYVQAEALTPNSTHVICTHLIRDPRFREQLDRLQEYDTSYSVSGLGRFRVNR